MIELQTEHADVAAYTILKSKDADIVLCKWAIPNSKREKRLV